MLAAAIAIWAFTDVWAKIVTTREAALLWVKISGFGWIFIGATSFHFASVLSGREKIFKNKLMYLLIYAPGLFFLGLHLTTNLIYLGVEEIIPLGGYAAVRAPFFYVLVAFYILLPTLIGLNFLIKDYTKNQVELKKKQLSLVSFAYLLLAIGIIMRYPLAMLRISVFEISAAFSFLPMTVIAVAIIKYKLFIIPPITRFFIPAPEAELRVKPKYKLKEGQGYLIKEKEPARSLELFMDQTKHDVPGLWITSLHPKSVEKYGLKRTPVLSLTSERIASEVTLSPDKLDRVEALVLDYLHRVPGRSVVLVDCFRELVVINGFKRALEFIQELGRICSENASNLIVRVDPEAFTKKQLTTVDRALGGWRWSGAG